MTPLVIQYHASRTVAAQPAQHRPHNIVGAAAPAACMALPEQGRPEPRLFFSKKHLVHRREYRLFKSQTFE